MENNNNGNNGRGIFYGVMGVATLIVTIIGATFAYFAAAANSTDNAIRTTGAVLQLGINDINDSTFAGNLGTTNTINMFDLEELIPVDADGSGHNGYCYNGDTYMSILMTEALCSGVTALTWDNTNSRCMAGSYAISEITSQAACELDTDGTVWYDADDYFKYMPVSTSETDTDNFSCVDSDKNNICSVYTFEVSNEATSAQTVYVYVGVTSNEIENLHYAVFKGTPEDIDGQDTTLWDIHESSLDTTLLDPDFHQVGDEGRLIHANSTYGTVAAMSGSTVDPTKVKYVNNSQQILAAKGSASNTSQKYTIVSWIQETGHNQTSNDSGKAFNGFVYVTTSDPDSMSNPENEAARSGVTGNLNLVKVA